MEKHNIANGINLYYIETEKFKTFSAVINIYRRLDGIEASKNALLLNVLKKGSEKYPSAKDISKELERNFGARLITGVKKKGDIQQLSLAGITVSDEYSREDSARKLSEFMLEILLKPLITEEAFNKDTVTLEKENLKNLIESVLNDKREYAEKRLNEEMYKDEPFGVFELGKSEDVAAIDEKGLYDHYNKILKESVIDIFITGSVNAKDVFINAFKDFNGEKQEVFSRIQKKERKELNIVKEEMEVDQAKLAVGFRINDEINASNYYVYMMYNSIFGGGVHSKLFNNVREKLSLAYYAYSRFIRFKGMITVGTGILCENYEKARNEIFNQAMEIEKGNVTEKELENAKISLETFLRSLADTQDGIAEHTVSGILSGIDDSIETAVEKIWSVSKEEVIEAAGKVQGDTIYFLAPKGDKA